MATGGRGSERRKQKGCVVGLVDLLFVDEAKLFVLLAGDNRHNIITYIYLLSIASDDGD